MAAYYYADYALTMPKFDLSQKWTHTHTHTQFCLGGRGWGVAYQVKSTKLVGYAEDPAPREYASGARDHYDYDLCAGAFLWESLKTKASVRMCLMGRN